MYAALLAGKIPAEKRFEPWISSRKRAESQLLKARGMVAIGHRASMISLVASSARVIDVMVEKRRHLGEAKKATTASEKVRQPRKIVKNTSLREPDKCNVLHVTREAF